MRFFITKITNYFIVAGLACGLWSFFGCSHWVQPQEPDAAVSTPIVTANGVNGGSGNSYYFYSISQLQKKQGNLDQALQSLQTAIRLDPEALFLKKEMALLYLQKGDPEKAGTIIQQILKKNPDHVEALIMQGSLEQNKRNNKAAQEAYERVLANDPSQKSIYLLLGSMYMEEEKYSEAAQVYQKLVKKFPDAYFGYYFLGKIYKQKGDYTSAEKHFLKTLDLEPKLIEIRFELIELYEKEIYPVVKADDFETLVVKKSDSIQRIAEQRYNRFSSVIEKAVLAVNPALVSLDKLPDGFRLRVPKPELVKQHEKALAAISKLTQMYKNVLEFTPENDRAAIEFGLFYAKIGLMDEAAEFFKQVAEKSRTDQSIADNIGFLFFDQKKYEDAAIVLNGMLKAVPESSDLNYLTGAVFVQIHQSDKAVKHFLRVGPESNFYENAVINVAYIYQNQKEIQRAIQYLEQAVKQKPTITEFYLYLGAFYEEADNYTQAESILKAGLEVNPNNTRLLFRLGVVYDKWNKKEASVQQMQKVIQLDPDDAHALNYLGYTFLELNQNLEEAEQLIRKALELLPEDGYITDSLGWLYFKQGNYAKAVEILEKAASLVADDPIILEHLGDAYLKTEKPQRALEFYRRALASTKKKDAAALEIKIQEISRLSGR